MFGRTYRYEPFGANVDVGIAALAQAKGGSPHARTSPPI